jgi:N-acyl-D-amino-acid deacylase
MYDLVVRGGKIVDGRGGPAYSGDIGIKEGCIAAIGKIGKNAARQTIEAGGAIVTPGFIDVHTHYDGQFLWDDRIDPSFSHGVTTTISGNCGVGFAPARVENRRELVDFMTGVEDIPGIVLDEGLDWNWTSFPDYLNRVAERRFTMDVSAHIPHGPVRIHVMGDRALRHEAATPEDIDAMSALVREAMAAGAAGFSTGRLVEHRSANGNNVPGTFALEDEVLALARAMGAGGRGVFQVAPRGLLGSLIQDSGGSRRKERLAEHRLLEEVARVSGRPVTYGLAQIATDIEDAPIMIAQSDRAIAHGVPVYPQVSARGAGLLFMLDGYHIFWMKPSYRAIAHLPLPSRLEAMRDPSRRAAILDEPFDPGAYAKDKMLMSLLQYMVGQSDHSYILASPNDFEPTPNQRLSELAATAGKTTQEYLYDHYTSGDGSKFNVNLMANYAFGNLDSTRSFLMNPNVVSGLGDGGAHLKMICDGAIPTFEIAYWTRDRSLGEKIPLEFMVTKMTSGPARLYGLNDRGSVQVGKRADINVIDYERLTLGKPHMVHDLPGGSGRIAQASEGYVATLVAGAATRINDGDTGARPGRLIRSSEIA